jgi:site-specific recombinase XerC
MGSRTVKASNLALSMKAARPDGRAGWEARARSDLTKSRIEDFLAAKLRSGFSRNTVRIIHAPLRAMLNAAVDDGAILANPANRLGRQLRLVTTPAARQEEIKAMTREQLVRFLAAAARTVPGMHAPFLLTARTGVRLGESTARRAATDGAWT